MLLAVALLAASAAPCRGKPRVATAEAARRVAQPLVAKRGAHDPDHDYRLVTEPNRQYWLVYQELITDLPVRGGGGLTFLIDRCSGKITDLHYMR